MGSFLDFGRFLLIKMNSIKGEFGIDDKLSTGLQRQVDKQTPIHPIQMSERHYHKNQEKALAENMRKVQGLHAPLKMIMRKRPCPKSDTFLASPTGAIFNLTSSKVTMK